MLHEIAPRDSDDGLEMHDNSCGECGHPYKAGDETHYPECSGIQTDTWCICTHAKYNHGEDDYSSQDCRVNGCDCDSFRQQPEQATTTQPEADAGEGQATPTPWTVASNWIMRRHPTCDVRIAVCDAYTAPKQPSDMRDRANAKLIVTAVNHHALLVEALEQCVNLLGVATGVDNKSLYASPVRKQALELLTAIRQS